jgi:hypothetical protein
MFYTKNLPAWERIARLVAAAAMGACAARFWGTPVGYLWSVLAIPMGLTSVVGFCPMCALAGRKIAAKNKLLNQGSE